MIERSERDGVVVLTMAHGKANALDVEMLRDVDAALSAAAGAKGVVLTGTGRIFSAGVDLVRLTSGGVAYVREFLPALSSTLKMLFAFPRPVVAAVNGHAIAGGCVIAAACDRRLMARGEGKIGVPELLVGVPYPTIALELMRARLSFALLQEAVLTARTYAADMARERGLVDELVEPALLVERAVEIAAQMGSIPAAVFALAKRQLIAPVMDAVALHEREFEAEVARTWESPEALAAVKAYVERTLKK